MLTILLDLIPLSLMQGLILSLPAIGIMVSFRLFNTADLTPEGTFTLGAAVTGLCLSLNLPVWIAFIFVAIACGFIGALNRLLGHLLKIDPLLSGIIMLTMLFSVYLRVMGTSNLPLFDKPTVFLKDTAALLNYGISIIFVAVSLLGLYLYLKTSSGLVFLTAGKNPELCNHYGFLPLKFSLIAGTITSICSGIGGSLMTQYQEFADINMGIGILVQALASLMIGEVLVNPTSILHRLLAPVMGSLIYQLISSVVISMGLAPTDLKFMTGILVLIIIALRKGSLQRP